MTPTTVVAAETRLDSGIEESGIEDSGTKVQNGPMAYCSPRRRANAWLASCWASVVAKDSVPSFWVTT